MKFNKTFYDILQVIETQISDLKTKQSYLNRKRGVFGLSEDETREEKCYWDQDRVLSDLKETLIQRAL